MAFTVRLLLLLIASLFLVPESLLAQNNDGKVAVGAFLVATAGNSSSWLSPSGDFAFGFRQLENSDLFLLSVWYAKIPDKTIVWFANGDSHAAVAKGSVVNLTAESGLVLTSPQGVQLWRSEYPSGVVAFGVVNDTGNFVLQDGKSETLWETFNNPTHTVLPGQDIEKGGKLWSQQSQTNFSKGKFQLRMQDDGNLVLVTINLPTEFANQPYYASDTTGDLNSSTAGTKLEFNSLGYMYVLRENGEKFNIKDATRVSATTFYLRATLNFDGVFALYSHPKSYTDNNVSWSLVWSVPDNICSMTIEAGLGVCGYNSICTLQNQRPTCKCLTNYSLQDPSHPYGNCPDFTQGCEEDDLTVTKDLYEVVMLTNTDWATSYYMRLNPSTSESCNQSCFGDCMCAVAIFRAGYCWKKKLPLSNGRQDGKLNTQAFIKVRKGNFTVPVPQLPNQDDKKRKNQTTLIRIGPALLGTSVFVNLMLSAIVFLGFFFIYRKKHIRPTSNQHVWDSNLHAFSYEELLKATNGFNEELGKGAFGVVYKGILQIFSGVQVAVKKLRFVSQDSEKEFKAELNIIGRLMITHHKNLVRLVGYCDEEQERLLVYEFLSNGTLANYLFADTRPGWRQRIDVAYGVARGLQYLHEECSTQIIHCDIKPQNILLDDYYNARIADFGLAKLLMMNQSRTRTAIRGTKGYVAPEWFRNMPITTKVDVYSFGVVLLEVICCRRSVEMENISEERAILTNWVYDCYLEGVLDAVVDYEVEALNEKTTLERFIMVALWCIQEDPSLRPTMRKVMYMLEGVVEVHVPPSPSPYSRTG
ncbi:LOW QUALITY PROTEIN: G-type lectin S-receptor-like serine/threonine-protein kinase RLK1 [Argentina anserina]|uniref:LOW QUALITY PROTEIN: G-type lectin S-receptor-like serine/threonine-protein kinase RLK1 n=1 Tax=Argentina anserina TaxID=57926 RepID=UPI0021767779|nr:LOW QUALITY PROTEIN: G-type lectin S-receptor-like serine/threonine-protein kinase RLK1 [Potentilla anserina]